MTLAEEVRAEFARILKRYEGLPDAIGPIRVETVRKANAWIKSLQRPERQICACCGSPVNQFDPVAWLSSPSRDEGNPLASAAAVNVRKISSRSAL